MYLLIDAKILALRMKRNPVLPIAVRRYVRVLNVQQCRHLLSN